MDRIAESRHEQIWKLVDLRLELVVLYAVGDADGPCAGHVKIGVSTRAAYASEMKTLRNYRSSEVVTKYETIVSGKGRAELLKTALLAALGDKGFAYRSWRSANDGEIAAIVGNLSTTYGVALLSHDDAIALEHQTFEAIAEKEFGGPIR